VQRELGRRGYKPGIPNGEADAATRSAIMAYQHDHGLPLTGEPSDALLKAIVFEHYGAIRAPANSVGTAGGNLEAPIIPSVGAGGHEARPIAARASTTRSPPPGSTADHGGPIGEGATFSESNGVDVIRAAHRELGRRGYKPGIPNGEANVATRSAIMAYQHDHGLRLTGEPSNALFKVIMFESAGAVRATDHSIGTGQGHNEVAIIQPAPKPHTPTSRARQRTTRDASDRCAGADRRPSRSTCDTTSQARAKPTPGIRVPSARVAIDAAHLSNGWTSPLDYGWQMITGSTSAPRTPTSSTSRKPMSGQKPLNVAVGSSRFESQIWTQLEQIR
jgi:peptidoglycan hydrolase-like protein with peptidoglycan-binding domain